MKMRLEALKGCKLAFLGFSEEEQKHMEEVAVENGTSSPLGGQFWCRSYLPS